MACNPPYKRGLTGKMPGGCCEFPGVLRQDCYDYINFDYYCSKVLYCLEFSGIKLVFWADHGCDCAKYSFYFGSIGGDGKWDQSKEIFLSEINLNSTDGPNPGGPVPPEYSCYNDPKKTPDGTVCCVSGGNVSLQTATVSPDLIKNIEQSESGSDCINVFVKLKCESVNDPGHTECTTVSRPPDGCHGSATNYIAFSEDGCCLSTGTLDSGADSDWGQGVAQIKICCNNCPTPTPTPTPSVGCNCCVYSSGGGLQQSVSCIESTDESDCYSQGGSVYTAGVISCPTNPSDACIRCDVICMQNYGKLCSQDEKGCVCQGVLTGNFVDPYLNEPMFYSFGAEEYLSPPQPEYASVIQEESKIEVEPVFSTQATSNCNITAQLRTTGCCLEFEESTGRMYAVGAGTVTARIISGYSSKCCPDFALVINGKKNSKVVIDGEYLTITTSTKCKCNKKSPWRTPGGFKPGPCHKGPPPTPGPFRILKNIETGVYQIQLNTNSSQNDCGCG